MSCFGGRIGSEKKISEILDLSSYKTCQVIVTLTEGGIINLGFDSTG